MPKSVQDAVRSSHSSAKDKTWVSNAATVSEKGEINTDGVITWGGFKSQCMWICQTSIVILPLLYLDIIHGHCKVMLLISEPDAYNSSWLGSATLSHIQRAPMTIFRNLR